MVISKLINNNYVVAANDDEEVIVKGIGVGYKKSIGSIIHMGQIEKIYRINNNKTIDELSGLLKDIPDEQFQVCDKVIDFAKKTLKTELNPNLYVTLTDHVNFAIFRLSKGITVANPMLNEIKSFYPKEFEIGKYAITQIDKKLGLNFGDDEAGFSCHQLPHGGLDLPLGLSVHVGGSLVQDQHGRVGKHGAGNGQQLLLPLGDVGAVVADHRVITLRQTADKDIRLGGAGGGLHLLPRSVGFRVGDVFMDGAADQP